MKKKKSAIRSTCQIDMRNIFSYINLEVPAFKCLRFAYLTLMHYIKSLWNINHSTFQKINSSCSRENTVFQIISQTPWLCVTDPQGSVDPSLKTPDSVQGRVVVSISNVDQETFDFHNMTF